MDNVLKLCSKARIIGHDKTRNNTNQQGFKMYFNSDIFHAKLPHQMRSKKHRIA